MLKIMRKQTEACMCKPALLANPRDYIYTPALFVKSSREGEYFTINFWRIQKTSVSGRVLGEKMVFLKMYQHVYFHLLSFISDTKRLG